MEINFLQKGDLKEVIELVLHCRNDGTREEIGIETQMDLARIEESYMASGGNFWVARENGKLAGTIALIKYNDEIGILKKFFVYENYRGNPHYPGQKLYNTL